MIARRELDRRQLIAARSEAVLHVVLVRSNFGPHGTSPGLPFHDFNGPALREAAARTGGELHTGALSDTPVEAFRKILDDYRQSYVLHYTPTGVPRGGWHGARWHSHSGLPQDNVTRASQEDRGRRENQTS
jgi:hypothetical protein